MKKYMVIAREVFLVRNLQLNALANAITIIGTHSDCRILVTRPWRSLVSKVRNILSSSPSVSSIDQQPHIPTNEIGDTVAPTLPAERSAANEAQVEVIPSPTNEIAERRNVPKFVICVGPETPEFSEDQDVSEDQDFSEVVDLVVELVLKDEKPRILSSAADGNCNCLSTCQCSTFPGGSEELVMINQTSSDKETSRMDSIDEKDGRKIVNRWPNLQRILQMNRGTPLEAAGCDPRTQDDNIREADTNAFDHALKSEFITSTHKISKV